MNNLRLWGILKKVMPEKIKVLINPGRYFLDKEIESFAGKCVGKKVLDVGAGDGVYKSEFKKSKYTPTDITLSKDVLLVSDCRALPIRTRQFDAAIYSEVIEHVFEYNLLAKEAYRILKMEGLLFISAPQMIESHLEPYHYFNFTKHGLIKIFKNSGFKLSSHKYKGHYFALLARLSGRSFVIYDQLFQHRLFKYIAFIALLLHALVFSITVPAILLTLDKIILLETYTFGHIMVFKKQ